MKKGVSTVIATILMLIITIALAGMAYMYIAGVFTARTQGMEVVDAYCIEQPALDNVTMIIRNIGTTTLGGPVVLTVTRTSPSPADNINIVYSSTTPLGPGKTVEATVGCPGTGGRACHYRLIPPLGGTLTATAYCT